MEQKDKKELQAKKQGEPVIRDILKSMDDFFTHSPLKNIVKQMDEFFTNALQENTLSIETTETDNEFLIFCKLPGVKKDQITIETFDKYVTITVKHEEISEMKKDHHLLNKSISYKHASRTIPVPPYVKTHQLKANYQDGLLKIIIPKKQRRKYEIEG
ncbi:Hsp20/alpha crystallin family protein [Sutcliffiella cohnii]|nr:MULTISPECIES: Hsp20/alpha crystallin family protein [Sutcliffiella]MED4014810.1 Hsp20/alpha crystallin family protein [Sutcliffiella cohnii]WBL17441.1 Hsp20/alpha crystallin family protein [Sutcliffiella sp. NC1]